MHSLTISFLIGILLCSLPVGAEEKPTIIIEVEKGQMNTILKALPEIKKLSVQLNLDVKIRPLYPTMVVPNTLRCGEIK